MAGHALGYEEFFTSDTRPWYHADETAPPSSESRDLPDLIHASVQLDKEVSKRKLEVAATATTHSQHAKPHKPKAPRYTRDQKQRVAEYLVSMGQEGEETFVEKMARQIKEAGIELQTVTVEYNNVNVTADALVGSAGIPTLTNTAVHFFQGLLSRSRMQTQQVGILKNVSGVLKPGRLTLLLGPPGAGKTVFLQTLAGRLKSGSFLNVGGDIKYNGAHANEFVIERTVGLVDQYDDHIANLTVHETLAFAQQCQMGLHGPEYSPLRELVNAKSMAGQPSDGQAGAAAQQPHCAPAEAALRARQMARRISEGLFGAEDKDLSEANTTRASASLEELLEASTDDTEERERHAAEQEAKFEKLIAALPSMNLRMEIIIRLLGLQGTVDTVVGNAVLRGLSGGERKRVTSAEMLVGNKTVMLMDEISTGLDSATTFSVIKWLALITRVMGLTTVISLLQPPPEVYNLFDDVLLLTDGQVCYHGPVSGATKFFSTVGFDCPVRKDPASFLQEVTTPKGQLEFASEALKARLGIASFKANPSGATSAATEAQMRAQKELLVSVDQISAAFWEDTVQGREMRDQLDNHPFEREKGHPKALTTKKYALGHWAGLMVVTKRQLMLTFRDKALARGRVIQVAVMSLIIGSLFFNLPITTTGSRSFFGVSFLSVMFLAMGSMPQLAITFITKSVFFKHRDNHFFPPWTYAVAAAITQLPLGIIETTILTVVVYFMVGFYVGGGYYLIFWVVCFCAVLVLSALFRLIACTMPSMVIANSVGSLVLLILVITSGFAIVRTAIPGWYIWAYYISPFAYALRAIVINEMTSPQWAAPVSAGSSETIGMAALLSFSFFTKRFWIWVGILYELALFVVLTGANAAALTWTSPPKERATMEEEVKDKIRQASMRQLDISVSQGGAAAAANAAEQGREENMEGGLGFTPITLVLRDVKYYVDAPNKEAAAITQSDMPGKLMLLKGITAHFRPGLLTALMGGTGAGKTTLMDVVAGRKTQGIISGDILVNGYPKEQGTWSRVVGYVEQMDIHSPALSVKESLMFSARLRLSDSMSLDAVKEHVEDVMDIVELTKIQSKLVGQPNVSGLSVEQRKRLSIAVELVANPSVVFMDEPTSGLDARAAAIVMRAVKNVSRNGRTVLVTIHQPSIEIFESFDDLVLLQKGGRLTYFGSLGKESCDLIAYLEAVPGVVPIAAGANPATWMLEVSGGSAATSVSPSHADFPALYKESQLCINNAATAERLAAELQAEHQPLSVKGRYATSKKTQFIWLQKKWMTTYWRSPAYNLTRMLMTTLISLFYGTMYLNKGQLPSSGASVADVQNIMGVLFSSSTFQGMMNFMAVLPVVGAERPVFNRERAASMYSTAPYSAAVGLVEVPYLLVQVCIFVPISYWLIGFKADAGSFFFYCLIFLEAISMFTFMGQLLVYLTPSAQMAQILGAGLNTLWTIMNGFVLPYSVMPNYWQWLNRATPTTWIIYAFAVSQLGTSTTPLTGFGGGTTTAKGFMQSYFGYSYDFRWQCVAIVGAFILTFRVGAIFALKYINYQRR